MASKKPTQAPVWDVDSFVAKLNQIAAKVGVTPFSTTAQPAWKRWVEATGNQDVVGLRDVVNANALYEDAIKSDVDAHSQAIIELTQKVQALEEAPAARPFP